MKTYRQWRSGHKRKINHPDAASAQAQVNQMNGREPIPGIVLRPVFAYPCRWTDDYREGEVGRIHFHVASALPRGTRA